MTYKSAQDPEATCKKCPRNLSKSKLSEIEHGFVILPWLTHLFYLDGLRRVGATWSVNDLTKREWDGLLILEAARIEIERERLEKMKRDQMTKEAMEKAKRGGKR